MSTRTFASLILAVALAMVLAGSASAQGPTARLGTFEKNGQDFFALSLMPQVAADAGINVVKEFWPRKRSPRRVE